MGGGASDVPITGCADELARTAGLRSSKLCASGVSVRTAGLKPCATYACPSGVAQACRPAFGRRTISPPWNGRCAVEVDAECGQAWAVPGEALAESLPTARVFARPGDLGERQKT